MGGFQTRPYATMGCSDPILNVIPRLGEGSKPIVGQAAVDYTQRS